MTTAMKALPLIHLYERDETAWLDIMSTLAAQGRYAEMDHPNLSEFLADMAKRDRREVFSRLVVLLAHLLKREHQPNRHTAFWQGTIVEQRRELRKLLESSTLHNHAFAVLTEAYDDARRQASAESEMPLSTFLIECKWELDHLLVDDDGLA